MKKFYYLLAGIAVILVTIVACEQASIEVEELQAVQDEVLLEKGELSAKPAPKIDICHYDDGWVDAVYDGDTLIEEGYQGEPQWITINISMNALPAHLEHGDVYFGQDDDGDGYPRMSECDDLENPREDGLWDCDDTNDLLYPFSPVGDFVAISSGYSQWDMSITSFDGTNFEGTARFPAGATTYIHDKALTGTVVDGVFHGMIADFASKHDLTGTVSECGGVDHLDWKWALLEDVEDNDGDGYYDKYDCDDTDANINKSIDADGDGINSCVDCDDAIIAFTPEGSYTFRKVIDRGANGIITGDYIVELTADDVNGDFTGTGVRYDIPNGGNAYVDITGNVDDAGDMTFLMEQWINDPSKTGNPQNYWTIDGTVDMCGGISEIHWVSGREGEHVFTLFIE